MTKNKMKKQKIIKIYEKEARKYNPAIINGRYDPTRIKVLFIAESPPPFEDEEYRIYFYKERLKSDSLFRGIMKNLFPKEYEKCIQTRDKSGCLSKFRDSGFFLIDVVKKPIQKREDNYEKVGENKNDLMIRIKKSITKETKIILIKNTTVCKIIYELLKKKSYKIIGLLPFPGSGNQKYFKHEWKEQKISENIRNVEI